MFIIFGVSDPGMVMKFTPSPALTPATASSPPSPSVPPDMSPVVHSIPSSGYRNKTNDSNSFVASTH